MATTTAAQRRHAEALAYREFVRNCPTSLLLDRIGDKWVTLLLVTLSEGALRYGELSRAVPGASQKMLTQSLRALERDGLLTRSVTPSVPVRVDYELTELGASLLPVLRVVKEWAERHMADVGAARADYDATQAGAERRAGAERQAGAERRAGTERRAGAERQAGTERRAAAERSAGERAGRLARVG